MTALNRREWSRGLTLLEVLFTLLIGGMIIMMAALSVGTGSRPYEVDTAARRFVNIAEYAMEEAQLSGTDLGVLIRLSEQGKGTQYSYQWMQRTDGVWREAPFDPEALGEQELPVDVDVILEIEEEATDFDIEEQEGDDELPPSPQIVFFASGEAIPGLMTWVDITSGEVLWELEWDLLGRFDMRRRGIENEDDE